jgi:hypothetical protein
VQQRKAGNVLLVARVARDKGEAVLQRGGRDDEVVGPLLDRQPAGEQVVANAGGSADDTPVEGNEAECAEKVAQLSLCAARIAAPVDAGVQLDERNGAHGEVARGKIG